LAPIVVRGVVGLDQVKVPPRIALVTPPLRWDADKADPYVVALAVGGVLIVGVALFTVTATVVVAVL
jgi:hypothetical protein